MPNIPTVTKNLLIVNVLAFLAMLALSTFTPWSGGPIDLNSMLGLHFFMAPDFHWYQLFTYMFMHGGFQHILFNMFALWMFGCVVERVWGAKKFLFYYISCGVGAGLFQELAQYISLSMQLSAAGVAMGSVNPAFFNGMTTVGASGAIYAILLAFGMLFPEDRVFVFPFPIPIKAKWLVLGFAAIELFSALTSPGDQVAHVAHLGGMVFGFFMIRYWRKHPGQNYGKNNAEEAWDKMKNMFGGRNRMADREHRNWQPNSGRWQAGDNSHVTERDDNARQQREQAEIDRILDKIRRSGYDSLTTEEKQRLFDQSRK